MSTRNLEKLFDPKSIAVIGASNTKGSVGYILLRNLIGAEYEGVVYPVNRTAMSVQGIQAYPTISQVPRQGRPRDHRRAGQDRASTSCASAARPACRAPSSSPRASRRSAPAARSSKSRCVGIAESYGLRIVGPNCLGYVRPGRSLNATFAHAVPEAGRVAFISQSGALGTAVLDWATANKVGFSAFVSVGSMCDVDFGDLIDYFGADPQTNSIILYVEALPDARKFMSAARHFAKTKPIIVVKSGRTRALGHGGRLRTPAPSPATTRSTARPSAAPARCASTRSKTSSTPARRCRASRARAVLRSAS